MRSEAVQLSHAELLLTLGMLGLPMPLALGAPPSAPDGGAALGPALGRALAGLAARGLLDAGGETGAPPAPAEPLAELVGAVARADSCLVVAERRGAARRAAHISARGDALVLHTSPRPRLHRLEPLAGAPAAAAWLAALVGARPSEGELPAVAAPAAALALALDALADGPPGAVAALAAAGVPARDAAAFAAALGPAPARLTIGVVSGLGGAAPAAVGALALSGAAGAWWCAPAPRPGPLTLTPTSPAAMRRELAAMVARLAPAA